MIFFDLMASIGLCPRILLAFACETDYETAYFWRTSTESSARWEGESAETAGLISLLAEQARHGRRADMK